MFHGCLHHRSKNTTTSIFSSEATLSFVCLLKKTGVVATHTDGQLQTAAAGDPMEMPLILFFHDFNIKVIIFLFSLCLSLFLKCEEWKTTEL